MQTCPTHTPWSLIRPLRVLALLLCTALGIQCEPQQTPQPGSLPESEAMQLSLSPSNPQIAQGTAQQFQLRGFALNGRIVDLTTKAVWSVRTPSGSELPESGSGLIEPTTPGRYQVTVDYEGTKAHTEVMVTTATIASLAISPTLPKVAKGLTQQFKATATFSDGTTQDVTTLSAWSVKDSLGTGVAVVNSLGLATAKNVGKARISARYLTKTTSTTLEVTAATVKSLTLSPQNVAIAKGTSQQFAVVGTFSDGTVQDVTASADWAVLDVMGSGVASIDGTGTAHGDAVGQAKVSAEYLGQLVETNLTVNPAAPTALAISPSTASLAKGTTQRFVATATFTDGTTQDVSAMTAWTSTDAVGVGVASIDASGVAKGNAVGNATISGSFRGYSASGTLTVRPAALLSVAMSPAAISIAKGMSQSFKLMGAYTDGTTQDLSAVAVWSATDLMGMDVISLSGTGVAYAKNIGQAQVKAEHMGQSATGTVTVTAAVATTLRMTPQGPSLAIGGTQQFSITAVFSDGSTKDVSGSATYSAADIAPAVGVASINTAGLATGLARGRATISASYAMLRVDTVLSVGMPRGVCSADGWCWRNPLPQGNYLPSIWGSDANNVWAVSDFGVIVKWDGVGWSQQATPTTKNLLAVWGTDAKNVWAVGLAGTILKWDGKVWTAQLSGTTVSLSGVWGTDANNVWAVGDGGVSLKWNGTAWSAQASGTLSYLRGVFGIDTSNVWAVGANGVILKWDGSTWTAQSSGTLTYLRSIWGTDVSNLWAVGSSGVILKWDGVSWATQASGTVETLRTVWGTGTGNLWIVGYAGTLLKWSGTAWVAQASGVSENLLAIWGSSASDLWAVGDAGLMISWNGTAWTAPPAWSRASLFAAWGSDASNVWFGGAGGTIVKWNGYSLSSQTSGTREGISSLWGTDSRNVWAVGSAGTIIKWDGSAWSPQVSGTTEFLRAVWAADGKNVWAVGNNGVILKWDGSAWSAQASGTTSHLTGVYGMSASQVWAVGGGGTVLKWDGSAWALQASDG